jgi:hypothetical protein
MKFKLVEFVRHESDHKNGQRIIVNITRRGKPLSKDDIDNLSKSLCSISLDLDILIDNSDGTYELCIPTRQDWMKTISDKVQSVLNDQGTIEIN